MSDPVGVTGRGRPTRRCRPAGTPGPASGQRLSRGWSAGRNGPGGGGVEWTAARRGAGPPRRAGTPAVAVSAPGAAQQPASGFVCADDLPDGLVIADHAGRVTVFNRAAARLTGIAADAAIGRDVRDVLALRDADDRCWWAHDAAVRRPVAPAPGTPSGRCTCRTAPSCWSASATCGTRAATAAGSGRAGAVRRLAITLRGAQQRDPARAQPGRPGLHRRARAALAADQRQGLHRHAAGQVAAVHRRPEAGDARDGQRRRRPGHPADHRAARRVQDRVRPDRGAPRARGHPGAGQEGHRRPGGRRATPEDRFRLDVAATLPETWLDADKIDPDPREPY